MSSIFRRFNVKDATKYTQIIGIDIGHGEFSAAVCDLEGPNRGKPLDLWLNNNQLKKLFTALHISESGVVTLGEAGMRYSSGEKYIYFKARPSLLGERYDDGSNTGRRVTKKELLEIFVRSVMQALKANNQLQDNAILFVGCPSSQEWLANDQDIKYAQIISNALMDAYPVVVIPESRASLIKAHHESNSGKRGKPVDIRQGVVVFDFGSSTADWTYFDGVQMIENSHPLGASFIERRMLEASLDSSHTLFDILDLRAALCALRSLKEAYYDNPMAPWDFTLRYKDGVKKLIDIDKTFMDRITNQESYSYSSLGKDYKGPWNVLCYGVFQDAKNKIGNRPCATVILTGGASRMELIRENCRAVFQVDPYVDMEPSFCVSRGLALAGCTDLSAELAYARCIDQIRDMFLVTGSTAGTFRLEKELGEAIGDAIYPKLADDLILAELRAWSNYDPGSSGSQIPKVYETLGGVIDQINHKCSEFLLRDDYRTLIRKAIQSWITGHNKGIVDIVNINFAKLYGAGIPEDYLFRLSDAFTANVASMVDFKLSFQSQGVINQCLGLFGGGQVLTGYAHPLSDRQAKFNRLSSKDRRDNLLSTTRLMVVNSIVGSDKFNYYNLVQMMIYGQLEGQVKAACDRVSLWFERKNA